MIVIDGTGSMRLVIDDVKAKTRQLMLAIHRLVPTARVGIIVFGGRGEQMQMLPLTTSPGAVVQFLGGIQARNGGEWQEDTLGAVRMAVTKMGWRSYAKKVIVLVGDTPPFKEDFDPVLQLIRQFHGENGTFNTVDLTVEEHERFVKQWQSFSGPVPVDGILTAGVLPRDPGGVSGDGAGGRRIVAQSDQGRAHQPAGADPGLRRGVAFRSRRFRPRHQIQQRRP